MLINMVLGFIGSEKYEIILYLSRVLCNLNKKVLVVDSSDIREITYSIPFIDKEFELIEYRQVDFLINFKKLDKIIENYDYIFIDFGFNINNELIDICNQVYFVTNLKRYNIEKMKEIQIYNNEKYLIIKEEINCKINSNYIIEFINQKFKKIFTVILDEMDLKSSILCQYDCIFRFKNISNDMKSILKEIIIDNLNMDLKSVKKAYYLAERGK